MMKNFFVGLATATMLALGSVASAATWSITDNNSGVITDGIANNAIYGPTLTPGDSISITLQGEDQTRFVGLGFNFAPVPSNGRYEVTFTPTDFANFGNTDVFLATSTDRDAANQPTTAFASANISPFPGIPGPFGGVVLETTIQQSPFYLLYNFTSRSTGSFTGDLSISVAPVPLPATLGLLALGLGGLTVMRRRKQTA